MESVLLNGLVLMHQQRYQEAISVFEAARAGKVWTPYLAYNLGVAQIRQGLLAEGARTLASLGEISGQREELRALRDKANLALGFSYLQRGDAEQSRAVLQRVRLQGPLSNKALLGSGWADAEAEQYAHALVPWQELGGRDPADPAVQEALLAAPYAMTKLQRHGAAVTQYGAAINTLLEEKAQLDAAIRSIRNGELLDILEQQDPRNGGGWLHQLALDTGSPVLRYQTTLMASHEFQEAVKNYLDLITLLNNLESWSEKTGAFDEILAARRQLYAMHEPAAAGGVRDTRRARLEQRHRELSARLEAARQSNDPVAIARTEDLARWNRLLEIGQQLERMPTDDRVERMRRKQQRLSGVLLWDLNSQFKARLHETRQELEEVGELLGVTNDTQQRLQDTRRMSPAQFTALGSRIGSGNRTIASLLDRTRELRQAQGEQIEQMAVAELQRQQKRIDIYVVQARFSMAQTYDLALQGQNGRSP